MLMFEKKNSPVEGNHTNIYFRGYAAVVAVR